MRIDVEAQSAAVILNGLCMLIDRSILNNLVTLFEGIDQGASLPIGVIRLLVLSKIA